MLKGYCNMIKFVFLKRTLLNFAIHCFKLNCDTVCCLKFVVCCLALDRVKYLPVSLSWRNGPFNILLCLMREYFTLSNARRFYLSVWKVRKGLTAICLTLSQQMGPFTVVFYSVWCQTILLVNVKNPTGKGLSTISLTLSWYMGSQK